METRLEISPTGEIVAELGAAAVTPPTTTRIEPSSRWPSIDFQELWQYRGLVFFLVLRDIRARYAQTVLGAGWAVLRPIMTMVVFTVVFGRVVQVPSDGVPYEIFSLSGLVAWNYFSSSFTGASGSLVSNRNLFTKVYFPRLVIPFSPVIAALVDLGIAFGILLLMMLFFGILPSLSSLVVVPLMVASMVMTAGGIGCWLTALNLQYRDIQYIVPFTLQAWMYASPIVYPMSLVPEQYRTLYALNPMVGVVEGFRSSLLGTTAVPWDAVAISLVGSAIILVSGALYFRKTERIFADIA
jgi:lipopolysaccharide transport system permease protein